MAAGCAGDAGAAGSEDLAIGNATGAVGAVVIGARRVRDGDLPDGDRIAAAVEGDVDGQLVWPVRERRGVEVQLVGLGERRSDLCAVDGEVDPRDRVVRRLDLERHRAGDGRIGADGREDRHRAGRWRSAAATGAEAHRSSASAPASAACVSGAWGAKVVGDVPRTPALVTARICGAAQLLSAAPAVQVRAPASAETASAKKSMLRRGTAMTSSGVVQIGPESHPPKGEPGNQRVRVTALDHRN